MRAKTLAPLLTSYAKIRQLVRHGRSKGVSVQKLASILMKSTRTAELPVLRQVAQKLGGKKRKRKLWGNICKRDDRMYRLLRAPSHKSGAYADQKLFWAFVLRSFKARAVCVISARWGDAKLPKHALCRALQPYAVYGRSSGVDAAKTKHRKWFLIAQNADRQ